MKGLSKETALGDIRFVFRRFVLVLGTEKDQYPHRGTGSESVLYSARSIRDSNAVHFFFLSPPLYMKFCPKYESHIPNLFKCSNSSLNLTWREYCHCTHILEAPKSLIRQIIPSNP
jgi:hypothetical protein